MEKILAQSRPLHGGRWIFHCLRNRSASWEEAEVVVGVRSTDSLGPATSRNRWARCVKHRGALLCRLGGGFGSSPCEGCLDFSSSFSRPSRAKPARASVPTDFDLSAVQIGGLTGNDRPLTLTVTLRLARSFALARWRHSISSPRLIQRTPYRRRPLATSATLPTSQGVLILCPPDQLFGFMLARSHVSQSPRTERVDNSPLRAERAN